MSTETVWSLIIGSLSVGLGWVLNEVSQIFRSLGENRRIKKRVLHDLLEINFVLSSLDFKPIVDLIMFKLSKELQIKFTNEDKESFNDFIHKTLYTNIEKNVIDELDEIDESYLNSVLELSKVDPIRAYYLRNKTRLFDYLENVEEHMQSINDEVSKVSDNGALETIKVIQPNIMDQLSEEIENLKTETLKLAGSIGLRTKYRVKKILLSQKDHSHFDMDKIVNVLVISIKEQNELFSDQKLNNQN